MIEEYLRNQCHRHDLVGNLARDFDSSNCDTIEEYILKANDEFNEMRLKQILPKAFNYFGLYETLQELFIYKAKEFADNLININIAHNLQFVKDNLSFLQEKIDHMNKKLEKIADIGDKAS